MFFLKKPSLVKIPETLAAGYFKAGKCKRIKSIMKVSSKEIFSLLLSNTGDNFRSKHILSKYM